MACRLNSGPPLSYSLQVIETEILVQAWRLTQGHAPLSGQHCGGPLQAPTAAPWVAVIRVPTCSPHQYERG